MHSPPCHTHQGPNYLLISLIHYYIFNQYIIKQKPNLSSINLYTLNTHPTYTHTTSTIHTNLKILYLINPYKSFLYNVQNLVPVKKPPILPFLNLVTFILPKIETLSSSIMHLKNLLFFVQNTLSILNQPYLICISSPLHT